MTRHPLIENPVSKRRPSPLWLTQRRTQNTGDTGLPTVEHRLGLIPWIPLVNVLITRQCVPDLGSLGPGCTVPTARGLVSHSSREVASLAWIAQRKVLSYSSSRLGLLPAFRAATPAGSYVLALERPGGDAAQGGRRALPGAPALRLVAAGSRDDGTWGRHSFSVWPPHESDRDRLPSLVIGSDVVAADDTPARSPCGLGRGGLSSKAVLPLGLAFLYPRWHIDAADPLAWAPLLAFATLLAAAWLRRGSWGRPVLFALLYFVLMLSPVLGFFNVYFMRYSYVADHYQYLALVGIAALLVGGLGSLVARHVSRAALVGAARGRGRFCAVGSAVQSATYRDAEVLYRSTIARNPDAFAAHYNLAHRLQAEGRLEEAAHHYRETLRIRPDDARASNNLGKLLEDQGQPLLAIGYYRRALEIDPELLEAHNNLALMLQTQGQSEAAILHFRTALRIAPDAAAVHYNLARLLERLGRLDQSIAHYRGALETDPQAEPARAGLARALAARARHERQQRGQPQRRPGVM